jgi:hypothetical protein
MAIVSRDLCEADYKTCCSHCFLILTQGLSAGEDEEAVKQRYRKCLATCQRAKEICSEEGK